jgi:hypothetical protein
MYFVGFLDQREKYEFITAQQVAAVGACRRWLKNYLIVLSATLTKVQTEPQESAS